MSHLVIAGVGGGIQPRLEINHFVRDDRQFSLYVQALNKMYGDNQNHVPSYFQVAGIHGLPYIAWDGAVDANFTPDPNEQWTGYCTHGSTLFPTWHRPYVMLVEQILNGYARQIADTYAVDKKAWKKAAANLRQPYWDWAQNIVPPPEVISFAQVEITTPSGKRSNVSNPLVRYKFHPIDPSFPRPYNRWRTTLRQPDSNDRNAQDNVPRLRAVLENSQRSTRDATYNMLTRITKWPAFSSHTASDGGDASNSIEAIHDNIHVLVGGNGHMSDPAVAAFDPIFWLHHCNVDRLLSLWSAINPDVWVTKGDAQDGTYTLRIEQEVDASTSLTPFWKTQKKFWLSSEVKDTRKLGYTYPEFQGLDMNDKQAVRESILKTVNRLYGGGGSQRKRDLEVDGEGNAGHEFGHSHHRHYRQVSPPLTSQLSGGTFSDWTARVTFKRHELGQSFSVVLFLDEVPEDPNEWLISPHMVGAHHAFVHGMGNNCTACSDQEFTEEGFVHLNSWIAEFTTLSSFDSTVIQPFLKQKLQWRVLKTDGTPADLKSLSVSIYEISVSKPPGAIIPVIGEIKDHGGIGRIIGELLGGA